VPVTAETTALGAAISAAVGCGMHGSFQLCVDRMVSVRKAYRPVPQNVSVYEQLYERVYRRFYDSVSELIRETAVINDQARV
jgi:sugar (pentulose or hexulose) kinase